MAEIDSKYFKEYRKKLGFTDQGGARAFFAAKDIIPAVDFNYIETLNERLREIVAKVDGLVVEEIRPGDRQQFCTKNIDEVFEKLNKNGILPRLNNQGRRPEEVYFSWMRGLVITSYFLGAISLIFGVSVGDIDLIGDDDLKNIESFKRTPKADLQINLKNGGRMRVEVQSGFQGTNDIKQHKVLEAQKTKREEGVASMVIHFDLFNGQVAFVRTDNIDDASMNWITRQQMEGQTVFNIDQNYFTWKLTEMPPRLDDLFFDGDGSL